ncbi:MAG: GGDEF domain-containing protein [Clostridiales Family XIII bacterium]|jgi:diguanylate cyclase (GGDEF)-like protein|nr:GGDEF domain-containing protein [Clostridiales Family XIII bacterium]
MPSQRSDDEWVGLVSLLLTSAKMPDESELDPKLVANKNFQKLLRGIVDIRDLSHAMSRGNLHMFAYSKGFVLSNLKALQANLRHLTWQTKQVAEGDFSQRVDFLGDFSDSFNEMASKLQKNTLELERLANIDFLTQVPNRRSAMQYLEQIFMLYKRSHRTFSVLMFDIDHFKYVNDNYGHDAGDKVLAYFSQAMRRIFRESDVFCRLGGEEFIAILPETPLEGAVVTAERARRVVQEMDMPVDADTILRRTVSVGASQAMPGDESFDAVIGRSDAALYKAKGAGRNKTRTEPDLDVDEVLSTAHVRFGKVRESDSALA